MCYIYVVWHFCDEFNTKFPSFFIPKTLSSFFYPRNMTDSRCKMMCFVWYFVLHIWRMDDIVTQILFLVIKKHNFCPPIPPKHWSKMRNPPNMMCFITVCVYMSIVCSLHMAHWWHTVIFDAFLCVIFIIKTQILSLNFPPKPSQSRSLPEMWCIYDPVRVYMFILCLLHMAHWWHSDSDI